MSRSDREDTLSEDIHRLEETVERIEFKLDNLIDILGTFHEVFLTEYIKDGADNGKK